MYVAPRPLVEDDPNLPARVAFMSAVGLLLGILLRSPMTSIYASLTLSLTAGMRGQFNPGRAIGGPIAFAVAMWVMATVVIITVPMPLVMSAVMALVYFLGFFMILRTGNPFGMLLVVGAALCSILGAGSMVAMTLLRDEMTKAALITAALLPVAYGLFPAKATWKDDPKYTPAPGGNFALRAAIRAGVMVLYSVWLYAVMDTSNVMLAIGGMFILTFPTNREQFGEVFDRTYATVIGGVAGLLVLGFASLVGHLDVLVLVMFLTVFLFIAAMFTGKRPAMVYQYAASVVVTLVAGAFTMQEPTFAFIQRVVLTFGGALVGAVITALLEALLVKPERTEAPAAPATV